MRKPDINFSSQDVKSQIIVCEQWITTWTTKIKTINSRFSSYRLKNAVESTVKPKYISNESFIAAAKHLGYKVEFFSDANAHFNMSFTKALRDSENSGLRDR